MKIYTKQGDQGETGLFGGSRVPKDHLRIQAYGTLDELNASLGIVLTKDAVAAPLRTDLGRIQGELFQLGAELATPHGKKVSVDLVGESSIEKMELAIDQMEKTLPPLKTFILPGGTPAAAELHLSRTICRRAERELVNLHRDEPLRAETLRYVNRLSDYLFVVSRHLNHVAGVADIPWLAPHTAAK